MNISASYPSNSTPSNLAPQRAPQPQPEPSALRSIDSTTLSPEAQQEAAVDPNACNNDWRCLQQLLERGLLS